MGHFHGLSTVKSIGEIAEMRLFQNLAVHGDAPALVDEDGNTISHRELDRAASRLSGAVGARSLVFCVCTNTVESITGYVSLTRAGHVCLMVSGSLDDERVRVLANTFEPNYFWAPETHAVTQGRVSVVRDGTYSLTPWSGEPLSMHPDLSVLMATSGSTGSPVMVRQSTGNLLENARSIVESLSLTPADRALTTLPMNYTYGLSIINSQLECGGSLVVTEASLMDRKFWNLVNSQRPTYFGGVPYTYEMLNRIGVKRLRDSGIRMLTQAGGKLSAELVTAIANECSAVGIDFFVMYGQTEATARMSVLSPADAVSRPSSIGKPIPGGRFRILDLDEDEEVPPGEIGELEYVGPNVTMGYAATASDLALGHERDGHLRTGDLAVVDDDGFYYVVGRRKRFVKLFGHRTNLDDIERHLKGQGHEVACTGTDDSLVVHVVGACDEKELADAAATFAGTNRKAVSVRRIDAIPRNDAGKVLYSALDDGGVK